VRVVNSGQLGGTAGVRRSERQRGPPTWALQLSGSAGHCGRLHHLECRPMSCICLGAAQPSAAPRLSPALRLAFLVLRHLALALAVLPSAALHGLAAARAALGATLLRPFAARFSWHFMTPLRPCACALGVNDKTESTRIRGRLDTRETVFGFVILPRAN